MPCNDAPRLWQQNFPYGKRVTTTFAVTVTAGTLNLPLVNHAALLWSEGQQELTATTTILSAIPDFSGSSKVGPPEAERGDVVTYTIVTINSGDQISDVVLSDPPLTGLTFARCHYETIGGSNSQACNQPPDLWTHDMDNNERITTTIAFTVTAGTLRWPVVNCATLRSGDITWQEICAPETLLNAKAYIYLPAVLRSYPPQPTGSLVIAQGNPTVFHPSVALTLSATVAGGDVVTQMRFSDDKVQWSDWEPFNTTKSYTLPSNTSGLKTVYAQFRGGKGGVSDTVSDQVYLSINGSFEDGNLSGWQKKESPLPVELQDSVQEQSGGTTPPADGNHVVLLGDTDYSCNGVPLGYAAIEQVFHVPSGPSQLTFKYIIWSQDASIKGTYDRFEVYVNGELKFYDGNMVNDLSCSQWWRVPSSDNPRGGQTTGWATGEVDLSAYAGQNVTISFRNYSRYDHWYNTYTYIDRITIEGDW
ncbi:MAG TPA: hypothetical protein ENF52_06595 [Chloroflexi bacterium]|nr:hypothetical protein [Chloroflexota bacterium]